MSKWLIPLFVAALFLACGIGFVISGFFGYHYTAAGSVTGFVVSLVMLIALLFLIVKPLDTLIDREATSNAQLEKTDKEN